MNANKNYGTLIYPTVQELNQKQETISIYREILEYLSEDMGKSNQDKTRREKLEELKKRLQIYLR